MTKKDEDNPDYISIVLCSKGLGANYAKENQLKHRWNKEKTIVTYKTHNGHPIVTGKQIGRASCRERV